MSRQNRQKHQNHQHHQNHHTHQNHQSQPPTNLTPTPHTQLSPNTLTPLHDLVSASHLTPQPVRWLWQKRIPLAGITLLDGDHGCGKTLLALQIAAAVSSGTFMPDDTPTIQGDVIIITPHTDPTTTQLQLLTAMGANLAHIHILSFVPDPPAPSNPTTSNPLVTSQYAESQCADDAACPVAPLAGDSLPPNAPIPPNPSNLPNSSNAPIPPNPSNTHPAQNAILVSDSRPFSLPEDSHALFQAIDRVNARLIIFDPFISLLSRTSRTTNERLCHLLADLNLRFLKKNIACLLIRNCPARGGHARPSVLERSDHFLTTAVSRLLLTPDPFLPNRLLLCHAASHHAALTPTFIFQIQPFPHQDDLARFTFLDSHPLHAHDFIEYRPDTLHRRLLSQHLMTLLNDPTNHINHSMYVPVSTLYALSPQSSPFQIQRSLNDLLNMGQIERPTRGFYTPTSTLNTTAATTFSTDDDPFLQLNTTAATTFSTDDDLLLQSMYTPYPESNIQLNTTAATTPTIDSDLTSRLTPADALLYRQAIENNRHMTSIDASPDIPPSQIIQPRESFWDMDY